MPLKSSQSSQPELITELPTDFESALLALEALVAKMESGELSLEASLESYERGVALSKICQEQLAKAEQQVRILEADLLKPFSGNHASTSS